MTSTREELRESLLARNSEAPEQAAYLSLLFAIEDSCLSPSPEYSDPALRLSALSYASQLGTTVHTDVLVAANGYLAFLKGESETKPNG